MPINIHEDLPVRKLLEQEGIFAMDSSLAVQQDIRPLKILILNLMPKKQVTELQLLRLLSHGPIQIDVDFLYMTSHHSQNTERSYLQSYYKNWEEVADDYYDGLIITGAPVEHLSFDAVDYIAELEDVMVWAQTHVYHRLFICWAAQFALNYYYEISKKKLEKKVFGIYEYTVVKAEHPILRGFDDTYRVPQSRHTTIDWERVKKTDALLELTKHSDLGPDILTSADNRDLFILGHLEYDRDTLHLEYQRDLSRGQSIQLPVDYYPNDDVDNKPVFNWRSAAHLLAQNWINQTYQNTPYNLEDIATL